ncbi:MAG TPA: DUF6230 family protein [Actinocrinis sp.]|nr:DUF6230 family protein [Actinocrinis sp.]
MATTESETPAPDPAEEATQGRVRLKRFAALMIPATLAGGALVALTAQGVLAADLSISGIAFTVTADHLHGDGFEQWGWIDATDPTDGNTNLSDTGGQVTVVVSAIHTAKLYNFCQSVNLGAINLVLRAGRGSTPVTGTDLVVDSDALSGDASFSTLEVGNDASTMKDVPGIAGPVGDFGQQAKTVDIDNLRQDNYATTAGAFSLPGLSMSFQSNGC